MANPATKIPTPECSTQPLALASGHGRHTAVALERTLVSVGEWPLHTAIIIFKRFTSETVSHRNGRFASETAKRNRHLDPEVL
jgi:hypothetical protein